MALYYQHTISEDTKLAIWYIEEDEQFFLHSVSLQQTIVHPHKRLQHLAGRYLLRYLFPGFPYEEIMIADTRKPYLSDEQYHFSISHCGSYAAAIVSKNHRVGIDIEIPTQKVLRISHKFMHENEVSLLHKSLQQVVQNDVITSATVLWSAKEALFKWYGKGDVDFKQHMQLSGNVVITNNNWMLPFTFKKNKAVHVSIEAMIFFNDLTLSWLQTDGNLPQENC